MIKKTNNKEEEKKSQSNNKNKQNNNNDLKIKYIDQKEKYNNINNVVNQNNKSNSDNNQKDSYMLNKSYQNKSDAKNKQNKIILKKLKDKENTLINEINSLKNKKNSMGGISYNNISEAKIDNNLHNNQVKNLKNLEDNLIDKLSEIKRQINEISSNNNSPKKNQKGITLITNTNTNINNNYNGSINKVLLLEQNEIRLMEIEKEYKNKQKKLKEFEEKTRNQKLKYLREQRQKEKEIILKRKKAADEKMENIKKKIEPTPDEKDCLYYKMEQNFQDNEKKLLHKITTERKVKNIYYKQNVDLDNIRSDFQNFKNQLQQRAREQTNNMKNLWHSRSMIMKKYETNMMKTLKVNDEVEAKNEQIMKLTRKGLFLEKEIYSKKRIRLPPIDEKLKEQSIKNQIDIKTLKGKERINFVNEKYKQKSFKLINNNKEFDYGKKYVFSKLEKRNNVKGNLKQAQPKKLLTSFSSEQIMNNNKLKNLIINKNENDKVNTNININNINKNNKNTNIKNYNTNSNINKLTSSADKIRIRKNPKEINYLNELKNLKKSRYHNWNKYIKSNSIDNIDLEGVQNINKKIESLDEKVNMGNELIKIKGGYEKNIDIGNQVSNMLIDSIKGKLEVIKELYNDRIKENNNNKK